MNGPNVETSTGKVGILLTALGGPGSLEEVGPFLLEVRGGRPTSPALVAEFRERYAQIGGKSPLLEISGAQARALEVRLNQGRARYRCRVGMRHWKPFIRDVLADMQREGLAHVVVLPLTPFHSRRTVGMYFRAVEEAQAPSGSSLDLAYVESWNTQPALISALSHRTMEGLGRLAAAGFPDPLVIFTAHSLPRQLIESGDDYEKELRETFELVVEHTGRPRSQLAFQSAGRSEEPWLGPPLEATLTECANAGEKAVLLVPFGFISDHLETLYDLDIEAKGFAGKLGLRFERADSLNTDPMLIEAMAHAVQERLSA
ncbi:Ferrochelatase [mine drainage metagenome]|uniref:Ferrochelatase n=1 Tax=mine drainage metagenome TaxID=410659 RepID=T1DC47_9ZZZZ